MALNPDDRYATATMMRTALRGVAEAVRHPDAQTMLLAERPEAVPGTEILGAAPGSDPMPAPPHLAKHEAPRRARLLPAVLLGTVAVLLLAVGGAAVALTMFGLPEWLSSSRPSAAPTPTLRNDSTAPAEAESAERVAELERLLGELERRATPSKEVPGAAAEIVALAEASGLRSMAPAPAPTLAGNNASIGPLELAGPYGAFQEFFRKLAARPRLVAIESMTLRKANPELLSQGLTVQATVAATQYAATEPAGEPAAPVEQRIRALETSLSALNAMARVQPRPSMLVDQIARNLPAGDVLLDEVVIQGNAVTIRCTARSADVANRFAKALEADPRGLIASTTIRLAGKAAEPSDDSSDSDDEPPADLATEFTIVTAFKP
jgi:hypothetical protein